MRVNVKTDDLRQLMRNALKLRDITGMDAEFMISDYMESELEGHKTHGLSKFLTIDAGLQRADGDACVVKQMGCYAKIDGCRNIGHLVALKAANLCMELAKSHGIGLVAFHNISRYSRVTPYARLIAQQGFVGILTNNGGPACVVPFGGRRGIFGTNPLCFGFPSGTDTPYIFDFATSQKVWGVVRQAIADGVPLPKNCFVDASGDYTTDPEQAEAAVPFGGPKGYALCYALEILTGAFVGTKMGCDTEDEYDLGYLFAALSPEMFTDLAVFKSEVDALAAQVRACPSVQPEGRVYIPGEMFDTTPVSSRKSEETELEEDIYLRLKTMSVSLQGGYKNNKKMN